ncbi:SMI1/KNR4 family protein [Rosenbergiella australiborealis]|uniref:SMI1/KNR4 family protein n=1 Tax=Rosenbergiella australiborealis TaxID=1544696 RepID=A0ABS5T887_9GAMM|nr:SMI1/KNR4 family protein [Rosenbergiella australiborealis]MBT0728539.1 SMI1/KNR4 family protein [Rosenbergiella australiborealis]
MINRVMMYQNFLYSGFSFPDSFVKYLSQMELEDIEPWWFFCCASNYVDFWCEKVRDIYPERRLIPFANWRYSDDIVCFDGADISGNPKVYYVHAFASAGWEDRGYTDNFDEWLKMARLESAHHKAELEENQE